MVFNNGKRTIRNAFYGTGVAKLLDFNAINY